ncbi:MAG: GntR family transcriptional regulator [Eubacteriales bacterium]|nr:GntR family transcriptional regulator [Eubacteriales bacterium]
MQWKLSDNRPIYVQLMETITAAIASGTLAAGSRLPSVREMAAQAGVNPNTMQRALAELERNGLLYSQRTAGRFVTDQSDRITQKRKELAMQQICIFLSSMKEMGYTSEQTLNLIQQAVKEEHS